MEEMKKVDITSSDQYFEEEEEEEVMLPGFRFHPTDEELVGFYLRRKVEKKPIIIELIKQIDIYKYDPWDLPKSNMNEKEWYFFCMRGRKYRNSIRPNRVTGSGFWKATGIDKPIFSTIKELQNQESNVIGLKKSLVYYKGSAGKGTKTDWMMHEFRLPLNTSNHNSPPLPHDHHPFIPQDAEVWTLCRIFKRIPSYRKYTPTNTKNTNNNSLTLNTQQNPNIDHSFWSSKKTNGSLESKTSHHDPYYNATTFNESVIIHLDDETKPIAFDDQKNRLLNPNLSHEADFEASNSTSFWNGFNGGGGGDDDLFDNGSWDELRPVVQFAFDPSRVYGCI